MTGTTTLTSKGAAQPRFIRLPEVRRRTGMSTSTIYRWMQAGNFPRSHRLGGHLAVWLESDVDRWIRQQLQSQ